MAGDRITPKQLEVVATIARLTESMGYPPTLRETAAATGQHWNGVRAKALLCERAGLLEHERGVARSWRVKAKHGRRRVAAGGAPR